MLISLVWREWASNFVSEMKRDEAGCQTHWTYILVKKKKHLSYALWNLLIHERGDERGKGTIDCRMRMCQSKRVDVINFCFCSSFQSAHKRYVRLIERVTFVYKRETGMGWERGCVCGVCGWLFKHLTFVEGYLFFVRRWR